MGRDDRNRLIDLRRGLDLRDRSGPPQTARQLVQVFDGGSIPTTVPKVFLANPAVLDADDAEGASYTTSVDNTVTIPVVVLGSTIPVAGDLIVAHAVGGRWVSGDSSGTTIPTCLFCRPCQIPMKDLLYVYSGAFPLSPDSGSGTLVFDGTDTWTSATFAGSYTIDLRCVSNVLTVRLKQGGTTIATFTGGVTCNPFVASYAIDPDSDAGMAGFDFIQLSDPGPGVTPCPQPCDCSNCKACGGIILLSGGTVTDDIGTHALTGGAIQCTTHLFSSARPTVSADGFCSPGADVQLEYDICIGCRPTDTNVDVTVTIRNGYSGFDCNSATPRCGWSPGSGATRTVTITPTCGSGTMTGTATFSASTCTHAGGTLPWVVSSVSFSIPLGPVNAMCQAFTVTGCNGLSIASVGESTVSVYASEGGRLLYSGTTVSGGIPKVYWDNVSLDGTYWITATSPDPRYQDYAASVTPTCNGTLSINLQPTDDYVCVSGCNVPLATSTVLHATHPTFGVLTMDYDPAGSFGAGWYDIISYSYSGCLCCPSKTVTVTCYLNRSLQFSDHWKSN